MIEFENITKHYGRTVALTRLSLAIPQGETLALAGPNGAGKTTLIRILAGLVRPTAGTVRLAGHDLQQAGVAARRCLGYLPQRAVLYGNLSARENLDFLAQLRGLPATRVDTLLGLLRLEEAAARPARTLSGGTLQRLGLAQALLADPPVLVFDEPMAGLDPLSVAIFKELLHELRAAGKTVLLSSHILGDIQELADRVAILDRGLLVALDSVEGLARRYALPERLWIELETLSGDEAELARRAGAASVEVRGSGLAISVPRERKLAVLKALLGAGTALRDIQSRAPSLEEIFLRLISPQAEGGPRWS